MPSGRFAPSPTGPLHLGNLRTALLSWLYARYDGSPFAMRMEDLDPGASRPAVVAGQLADLAAIGIDWDGPVVYQSQRRALYTEALDYLVGHGHTYPCFCSRREVRDAVLAPQGPDAARRYPGTCRDLASDQIAEYLAAGRRPARRFKASGVTASFDDRVAGPFRGAADDVVVCRGDGTAAYNLAVVVDDAAMGVELVVRGDDLLPVTPSQIEIGRALGTPPVEYAHVPLLRGPDGERLAKRHGAITLAERLALGGTAGAVIAELAASTGLCAITDRPTPTELVHEFAARQRRR